MGLSIGLFSHDGNAFFTRGENQIKSVFLDAACRPAAWREGVSGRLDVSVTGKSPLQIELIVDEQGLCHRPRESGVKARHSELLRVMSCDG